MRGMIKEHLNSHFEYLRVRRAELDAARNADAMSPESDVAFLALHMCSAKIHGYLEGLLETDEITDVQFRAYMRMLNDMTYYTKGKDE